MLPAQFHKWVVCMSIVFPRLTKTRQIGSSASFVRGLSIPVLASCWQTIKVKLRCVPECRSEKTCPQKLHLATLVMASMPLARGRQYFVPPSSRGTRMNVQKLDIEDLIYIYLKNSKITNKWPLFATPREFLLSLCRAEI